MGVEKSAAAKDMLQGRRTAAPAEEIVKAAADPIGFRSGRIVGAIGVKDVGGA